ncbi:hypothetical protein ACR9YC_12715 [Parasphingorhabdus sp. DH2-15]|uniref:hypothetical protein n=1 Tax=Parasphingorhabdus sp. DH2-15 TaxID=3444112 RepID=UPI003F682995
MTKNRIPSDGARYNRSETLEQNVDDKPVNLDESMDSYHEEERKLKKQLEDLEDDYSELEDKFYENANQLKKVIENKEKYEKIIAGEDDRVVLRDQKIADLEASNESLASSLSKHQDAIKLWSENADILTEKLETEKQFSKGWRKREQKLTFQFWSLAILGLAGTIWGSLGNPLPSFDGNEEYLSPSGKTADEQMIACIMQSKSGQLERDLELNKKVTWMAEKPDFYLSPKNSDIDNHDGIFASNLDHKRQGLGNRTIAFSGTFTTQSGARMSGATINGFYVAPVLGTDNCRFIWKGTLYADKGNKAYLLNENSTGAISLQATMPENQRSLEGAKWYFMDFHYY